MIDLYVDVQRRLAKLSPDDIREMAGKLALSYTMLSKIRTGSYPHSPTYNNLKACAGYLAKRKAA
jgi:hypothetical protein